MTPYFLTAALKIDSPTRVTVIRSMQIVISFVVQIAVWNEKPGLEQVGHIVIVVVAVLCCAVIVVV